MALKMNINSSNRYSMLQEIQLMNRLAHPNILRYRPLQRGICLVRATKQLPAQL